MVATSIPRSPVGAEAWVDWEDLGTKFVVPNDHFGASGFNQPGFANPRLTLTRGKEILYNYIINIYFDTPVSMRSMSAEIFASCALSLSLYNYHLVI